MKIYAGDVGTKIVLDAGCNISNASLVEIVYRKPNGDTGKWKAVVENSRYAIYITGQGDLEESGTWKIQLRVILPDWKGHGEIVNFPIYKSLDS